MHDSNVNEPRFDPGFRLSITDIAVLIIGLLSTAFALQFDEGLAAAIVFVVGHFFLFCNVFRMSRRLELVWAAVFLGAAFLSQYFHLFSWTMVFLMTSACSVVMTAFMMRSPSYHGIAWRRLNPKLPIWWESEVAKRAGS